MRIAVVGIGGLGGFFAALLARTGHQVLCLARGAQFEAVRTHGLTLKSAVFGEFTVPVIATDLADKLGPAELVLFCVKTYDLDAAAEQARPLVGRAPSSSQCRTGSTPRNAWGGRLAIRRWWVASATSRQGSRCRE